MKEDNRGITMVALVVMIIVLGILATIMIYQGTEIIKSAKLQSLNTNLLLVQAKIQAYSEQADFEGNNTALKGNVVTDSTLLSKMGLTQNDKIRSLSQDDLNNMGLGNIEGDHVFVIDYSNNEVYYSKGYEDNNGHEYYKLSEITKLTAKD